MPLTIQVDIVSAEEMVFSGEAEMVFAPAVNGEVGILPCHAPLLTTMRPGDVRILQPNGEILPFFVSGGILEIQPHAVTVLSDTVLRAEEIDEKEAEEARRQAEQTLQDETVTFDRAHAQIQLAVAIAKLKVVKLVRMRMGLNDD